MKVRSDCDLSFKSQFAFDRQVWQGSRRGPFFISGTEGRGLLDLTQACFKKGGTLQVGIEGTYQCVCAPKQSKTQILKTSGYRRISPVLDTCQEAQISQPLKGLPPPKNGRG